MTTQNNDINNISNMITRFTHVFTAKVERAIDAHKNDDEALDRLRYLCQEVTDLGSGLAGLCFNAALTHLESKDVKIMLTGMEVIDKPLIEGIPKTNKDGWRGNISSSY